MKKQVKLIKVILSLLLVICMLPIYGVYVSADTIPTESEFNAKISYLKTVYRQGEYWNSYNSVGYNGTGTISCPSCTHAGYGYCLGTCSDNCGQFYLNGTWYGGQCYGFANKMGYLVFGSVPTASWKYYKSVSNYYAGDYVRINNDSHSIFITAVYGGNVYYVDCNASGPCNVNWNNSISTNTLINKTTFVYHKEGNYLTGSGSVVAPGPVAASYSQSVKDGTYTLKNISNGLMMNVYGGNDSNGAKVTTWSFDGTTDEQFNIAYAGNNKYYIKAKSSSSGRVVDVLRGPNTTDTIDDGDVIDIYDANDPAAQLFYIVPLNDGTYVFELASKSGYVIAATDNTANGIQLQLKIYTGASSQKWNFYSTGGTIVDPSYHVNTNPPIHTVTSATVTDGTYTLRNVSSGYMMNVYGGSDANGTKVTMWQYDGSTDQRFKVIHKGNGKYYLYFNNSSRVLDVLRGSSTTDPINDGDVIDIYDANDPQAQYFYIVPLSDGTFALELASMDGYAVAANGANEAATNGAQLQLKTYNGASYQKWYLCDINGNDITKKITGISVKTSPTKTSYYTGDVLDTAGLAINVTHSDNSVSTITNGFTISYDFSLTGTKTVTVSYEGFTATFNATVKDAGSAVIYTDDLTVIEGDTVEIPIYVTKDSVFKNGNFTINYNESVLEYQGYSAGEMLSTANASTNNENLTNQIKMSFNCSSEIKAYNELFKIRFKVKDTSETQTYIVIENVGLFNADTKALNVTAGESLIKITQKSVLYGDVNNDGYINSKDSMQLRQFNAGYQVNINLEAADTRADGSINGKDSLLLRQYIADWDVELGK